MVLLLLGVFATLNWAALSAPTPLNLLVTRVEAPLGVIMVAVVGGLTALYFLFVLGLETATLLEGRRHSRELLAQQRLAEEAEASRFTELRRYLEGELALLRNRPSDADREVLARLDQLQQTLRSEIERAGNTLAAYIGELEQRLETGAAGEETRR
jgi:uncharacterized integral membrane protein